MSYSFPPDVQQMVESHISSGHYQNEDEVLRDALRALTEEDEDVAAVRAAIDLWRAGDEGTPLAEAFEEIRSAVK